MDWNYLRICCSSVCEMSWSLMQAVKQWAWNISESIKWKWDYSYLTLTLNSLVTFCTSPALNSYNRGQNKTETVWCFPVCSLWFHSWGFPHCLRLFLQHLPWPIWQQNKKYFCLSGGLYETELLSLSLSYSRWSYLDDSSFAAKLNFHNGL